ncbi:hypothetical protein VTO73DRAFT_4460 [Trametes versicolor]
MQEVQIIGEDLLLLPEFPPCGCFGRNLTQISLTWSKELEYVSYSYLSSHITSLTVLRRMNWLVTIDDGDTPLLFASFLGRILPKGVTEDDPRAFDEPRRPSRCTPDKIDISTYASLRRALEQKTLELGISTEELKDIIRSKVARLSVSNFLPSSGLR